MNFEKKYFLFAMGFIGISCQAHMNPEQIAEILRKKHSKMYEINVEGKKIMRENHEQIIRILDTRIMSQEVIEFLHKLAFADARDGKPHDIFSKNFQENMEKEVVAAEQKLGHLKYIIYERFGLKTDKELTQAHKKNKLELQKELNEAEWESAVVKCAWAIWEKLRNGKSEVEWQEKEYTYTDEY